MARLVSFRHTLEGIRLSGDARAVVWGRTVAVPLAIALVCGRALFRDGHLLQVDIVFGPRPAPVTWGFGAPVALMQAAAVQVVGGELAGKLYALGAFFSAGFAPMVLFRRAPWYAQSAAGVLGALNPWVYDRMVEGQWAVVVAAAGLFLWLAAGEALLAWPCLRRAVATAAIGAAIAAFDPHMLGPLLFVTLVGLVWHRVWRDPAQLRWIGIAGAMLALLLAHGVVSFFVADTPSGYGTVQQFTRADFAFFRSVASDDYGLIPNLIGLYGYWGERVGRFPLATGGHAWWPLATAVIVVVALAGALLRRDRRWLLGCGVAGLAISASTALPGGVDAATWLASRLPLVSAYREPQKWSALWLLAVVVLAASTVESVAGQRFRADWAAPALAYLLVLAALFPAGITQIRAIPRLVTPVRYPEYWYRTADYVERAVPANDPVVVLPWHLYQPLRVSEGRLVANPARVFFPGRLVIPANLEIPGRATDITSRYDRIGLVAARAGHGTCAVPRAIRRERVRWVIVLDAPEGREAVAALRRCGFLLVEGRPGRTAVLRAVRFGFRFRAGGNSEADDRSGG